MSVLAEMALPEVEEVHVIDRRLASFDLEQDPRLAEAKEIIRAYGALVACEETAALVRKAESMGEFGEYFLDALTRHSGLVRRGDPRLGVIGAEMIEQRLCDTPDLGRFIRVDEGSLQEYGQLDRHLDVVPEDRGSPAGGQR